MNKLIILAIIFLNSFQHIDAVCPPVCMIFCEHGNVLDANGCPSCECNPAPICLQQLCEIDCPEGFAKREDGCGTCDCSPIVCSPVTCEKLCENGWVKNEFGCEICQCRAEPVLLCDGGVCPEGFYCQEIIGKCPEIYSQLRPCTPKNTSECARICPKLKCLPCRRGYAIDQFGCQTCACRDPCERNDCVSGEICVQVITASGYDCIPACTCPKVRNKPSYCSNILDPCAEGCEKGSRCCKDESGCNSCFKCN